ncbi:vWA domain-containing protein [Arthrobacter sp. HLT1-20]
MTATSLLVGKLHQSDMLGGHHAKGRQLRKQTIRLGHLGHCPAVPTLTTFLPDDSGSLSGPTGNDPVSNRYAEARRALDALGRHCYCGNCLVAVVHFDTPTLGCIEPTPLTRDARQRLASGLEIPRDSAGTSYLGPSLAKAEELTANYPDHRSVLIILTDWALFDHDLASIYARIVAFSGTVFAVGLRSPVPDAVTGPNIRSITISADSPPGALARAVFEGLTVHRQPK